MWRQGAYPKYRRLRLASAAAVAALVLQAAAEVPAQGPAAPPFSQRQKVAPFPEGLDWINSGPLQPADLRGKFVLLDFWTLGCINCMHVIPELKELEAKYPKELVVIGVHSAKFDSEKQIDNIREAAARYDLKHPVVNDRGFAIWNHFGVRAWPSMVLVDPQGFSVWAKAGEVTFEELDAVLAKAIPFYRRQGLLDAKPLALGPVAGRETATPLCFPGKVLADEPGGRLFIADSNHHRIVVTRLDGSLLYVIGSGAIGRTEGDFATARFHQPQGMALAGQTLYVADTENHLIRKVDLIGREVSTVAGTGEPLRQPPPFGHLVPPLRTALSSPWDVLVEGGDLYVAMAGTHQICGCGRTARESAFMRATAARTSSTGRSRPASPTSSGPRRSPSRAGWPATASGCTWPIARAARSGRCRFCRGTKSARWSVRPGCRRRGCSPSATSTAPAPRCGCSTRWRSPATRAGSSWPTRTTTRSK
jgi:thiol-disulfide isomerase/thioredoxin